MTDAAKRLAVGVDVGGSGIKAAVVDVETGTLVSTRLRVPTPQPSEPNAVVPVIVRIVKRALKDAAIETRGIPIGVTMPSVVIDGVTKTAANIDPGWIDTPGEEEIYGRETMDRAAGNLPWGRLGRPEDIGKAAAYLASDDADYVTGAALLVDGGLWLNEARKGD